MTKAYTTQEQFKRLFNILPLESADMHLDATDDGRSYLPKFGKSIAIERNMFSYRNGLVVPCWSLAALIDALPEEVTDDEGNDYYLHIDPEDGRYYVYYEDNYMDGNFIVDDCEEYLLDACVNIIVQLHEKGLL